MRYCVLMLFFTITFGLTCKAQSTNAEENRIKALIRVFFNTNKDILQNGDVTSIIQNSGESDAFSPNTIKNYLEVKR